jgi:hypothetical protein
MSKEYKIKEEENLHYEQRSLKLRRTEKIELL